MGNAHREVKAASTESGGLDGLTKKDDLAGGGGEPLFIRVEDALRQQADGTNGWKAAGPTTESISVSPSQGGRRLFIEENGVFPLCRGTQYVNSKELLDNYNCHTKTRSDGIIAAKEKRGGGVHLVHPLTGLGVWVSEDGHRRPISSASKRIVTSSHNTARQVDLALTHSFRKDSNVGAGDFTSITFGLEDLDDAEEDLQIQRSTLSLPDTRSVDLDEQTLRPFTSPALSGNSIFVTSQSLCGPLTPRLKEIVLDSESVVDLSHNLESWMSLLPEPLQHLPLNYLYIPGEHGGLVPPA